MHENPWIQPQNNTRLLCQPESTWMLVKSTGRKTFMMPCKPQEHCGPQSAVLRQPADWVNEPVNSTPTDIKTWQDLSLSKSFYIPEDTALHWNNRCQSAYSREVKRFQKAIKISTNVSHRLKSYVLCGQTSILFYLNHTTLLYIGIKTIL